jgi:hypothetical protein
MFLRIVGRLLPTVRCYFPEDVTFPFCSSSQNSLTCINKTPRLMNTAGALDSIHGREVTY